MNDVSGNGNNGTISGATWTTSGKYGNALTFNGTNALVTVNNATSLQLTTGMTLEAWVYPTSTTARYRDVIYKGDDNYYLEATSPQSGAPVTGGTFTSELFGTSALPVNTWSYLAATYDRSTLRLYVNGVQVASKSATAAMAVSTNPLQIGGNTIYGSYYNGVIDEVRIYNRALTQANPERHEYAGRRNGPDPYANAPNRYPNSERHGDIYADPTATATFTPTPDRTATATATATLPYRNTDTYTNSDANSDTYGNTNSAPHRPNSNSHAHSYGDSSTRFGGGLWIQCGKRDGRERCVRQREQRNHQRTTWTTSGKYGNALSFNGSNASRVTVPDSASLHLTTE